MKIIRETKASDFFKKAVILFFATAVMGLACSCYYLGDVGADPTGVLLKGIHVQLNRIFPIEYGNSILLFNVILFFVLIIFQRKFIYFGTLINALMLGIYINFFNSIILSFFLGGIPLAVRYALPVVGTLIMGISLAIYIPVNWGASVVDAIILWLQEASGLSYKTVFWIIYLVFVVLGFFMGGVVGFGTIVAALFTGLIFDVLRKPFRNMVYKLFRLTE